jgi:hypothetical protein
MAIPLKYATASQEIPLGYFVDSGDGDTAEDSLTIANTDIKLWKNGATTLANKNSGGATHIAGGIYYATLDATDTDTVGPLVIFVHVSGALTVRLECVVYPAVVYDALFAGTDYLQVDTVQVEGSDATDQITASVPTAAAIRTEIDSNSTQLAAIVADTDELQTDDVPGLIAALNDPTAAAIRTEIDSNSTQLAAIVADTDELQTDDVPGLIAALNNISTADVNTQVADVMKTDTISEMSQQAPPATPTFEEAVMYLYMALRNKIDVTSALKEFHNDSGTVIWKKTLSDNGTIYSEAEGASGP